MQTRNSPVVKRILDLKSLGKTNLEIANIILGEGYRNSWGNPFSTGLVGKIICKYVTSPNRELTALQKRIVELSGLLQLDIVKTLRDEGFVTPRGGKITAPWLSQEWGKLPIPVIRTKGRRKNPQYGLYYVYGVGWQEEPKEQLLITDIKQMRENGLKYREIAEELNQVGRPPRNVKVWTPEMVASVLKTVRKANE
jgi:hypothetical protein